MKILVNYIFWISLLFSSCGQIQSTKKTPGQIEGKYYFKYPSGELEVIEMRPDSSYFQFIFENEKAYQSNEVPTYSNKGTWSISDNEIMYENWLKYCYNSSFPSKVLQEHPHITRMNVTWHVLEDNQQTLDFYAEEGYVFKKVE